MAKVNAVEIMKPELSYIEGDLYKEIFLRALQFTPEYFWAVPASTSGRYHPKTSLGEGGLVRHTKSAFRVAQELFGHPLYGEMFTPGERDEIRIAICLHDMCKQGTEDNGEGYVAEHPILVREALCPWKDGNDSPEGMKEAWSNISDMIDTHMCVWATRKDGTRYADDPSTKGQLFVHMCDYLASRRGIEMEALEEYEPPKLATEKQLDYIQVLLRKCKASGVDTQSFQLDKLSVGQASNIINTLKKSLGE